MFNLFQPKVLEPTPDPWFITELQKIDSNLRVAWGYARYFEHLWAIERRLSPERYYSMYASLFRSGEPRFVEQPIYDHSKPIFDNDGNEAGWRIVGWRDYDLAPEWEWVQFIRNPDGSFRPLDMRTITEIKRTYAWNRFHSLSRARFEKKQEEERKHEAQMAKERELWMESIDQAWHETGKIAVSKPSTTN